MADQRVDTALNFLVNAPDAVAKIRQIYAEAAKLQSVMGGSTFGANIEQQVGRAGAAYKSVGTVIKQAASETVTANQIAAEKIAKHAEDVAKRRIELEKKNTYQIVDEQFKVQNKKKELLDLIAIEEDKAVKASLQREKKKLDEVTRLNESVLRDRVEVKYDGAGSKVGLMGIGREMMSTRGGGGSALTPELKAAMQQNTQLGGLYAQTKQQAASLSDTLTAGGTKVDGFGGKLGSLVGKAAPIAGVVMAGAAAVGFLIDKAKVADDATDGLSIALAKAGLSGKDAEKEMARLEGKAGDIGDAFAMSKYEVMGVQAKIAAFSGMTGPQLDQLTELSIGAANAMGMPVEAVAKMLAKGADPEQEASLSKLGIVFDKNATAAERMAIVQAKLGPAIQATKDSTNDAFGSFDRLKIGVGDALVKIASVIFELLKPAFDALIPVVQVFTFVLGAVGDIVGFVFDVIKGFWSLIGQLFKAFMDVTGVTRLVNSAFETVKNVILGVKEGFTAVTGAVSGAVDWFKSLIGVSGESEDATESNAEAVSKAAEEQKNYADTIKSATAALNDQTKASRGASDEARDMYALTLRQLREGGTRDANGIFHKFSEQQMKTLAENSKKWKDELQKRDKDADAMERDIANATEITENPKEQKAKTQEQLDKETFDKAKTRRDDEYKLELAALDKALADKEITEEQYRLTKVGMDVRLNEELVQIAKRFHQRFAEFTAASQAALADSQRVANDREAKISEDRTNRILKEIEDRAKEEREEVERGNKLQAAQEERAINANISARKKAAQLIKDEDERALELADLKFEEELMKGKLYGLDRETLTEEQLDQLASLEEGHAADVEAIRQKAFEKSQKKAEELADQVRGFLNMNADSALEQENAAFEKSLASAGNSLAKRQELEAQHAEKVKQIQEKLSQDKADAISKAVEKETGIQGAGMLLQQGNLKGFIMLQLKELGMYYGKKLWLALTTDQASEASAVTSEAVKATAVGTGAAAQGIAVAAKVAANATEATSAGVTAGAVATAEGTKKASFLSTAAAAISEAISGAWAWLVSTLGPFGIAAAAGATIAIISQWGGIKKALGLAQGGILDKPTFAVGPNGTPMVAGEAGKEAVMPLSMIPELVGKVAVPVVSNSFVGQGGLGGDIVAELRAQTVRLEAAYAAMKPVAMVDANKLQVSLDSAAYAKGRHQI